eukprot:s2812_g2.t1
MESFHALLPRTAADRGTRTCESLGFRLRKPCEPPSTAKSRSLWVLPLGAAAKAWALCRRREPWLSRLRRQAEAMSSDKDPS